MKALIIVDMQNDFIDGALGTKEAASIVSNVVKRIETSKDELIIFTQDTHQEDYLATPEGKKLPIPHCIQGTNGWQIHNDIKAAWLNKKGTPAIPGVPENTFIKSVFGSTDLVDFLKANTATEPTDKPTSASSPTSAHYNITEIELLGVCTDICVISNAIMIKNALPHINITVNANCCAGVTPQSHNEALNTMKMCHIDVL